MAETDLPNIELVGSLSDFEPVTSREEIPRDGVNPAGINLSAGSLAPSELLSKDVGEGTTSLDIDGLLTAWGRSREEVYRYKYEAISPPLAIAEHSDSLFAGYIVPQIKDHIQRTGKHVMLVPELGYPLAIWNKGLLQDVTMMEGTRDGNSLEPRLYRYIREGRHLPSEVGVVYLDIPSTLLNMPLTRQQIIDWVNMHPDVLFIFDQANQGFTANMDDLFQTDLSSTRIANGTSSTFASNTRVLITNTTTKRDGRSGFAWCQGTNVFTADAGSVKDIGFGDDLQKIADGLMAIHTDVLQRPSVISGLERRTPGKDFREGIMSRKDEFTKAIVQLALNGIDNIFPFGTDQSSHIIMDVTQLGLGFETAKELVTYMQTQDISIKSAEYYGDPNKFPQLRKLAYISIPFRSDELMKLIQAFQERKRFIDNIQ